MLSVELYKFIDTDTDVALFKDSDICRFIAYKSDRYTVLKITGEFHITEDKVRLDRSDAQEFVYELRENVTSDNINTEMFPLRSYEELLSYEFLYT